MAKQKLSIAVHKLTSCSGCQLALLNQGPNLLKLMEVLDFKHFIEAGLYAPDAPADIALVEGSVSTQEDLARLNKVREQAKWLISIGACATSGGVQALRNLANKETWKNSLYMHPEFIGELQDSTPIAEHVHVDYELWGCPVTQRQLRALVHQLALGVLPVTDAEKLCMECKRAHQVCVLVAKGEPCMGPVIRTGCGALCPAFGRACYGCFGPSEQPNCDSLSQRFSGLGLLPEEVKQRFAGIHSHHKPFKHQIQHWDAISDKDVT